MESSLERRNSRRERRRAQVYDVALRMFVEQGFDSTTMEQIAEGADVARATVFNYYPRKSAFLEEWTARRRGRASAALEREGADGWGLRQVLGRYLTELAALSTSTHDETAALMTAAVQWTNVLGHPALAEEFSRHIRRAQLRGEVRPGVDADRAAMVLAASYFSILTHWISSGPEAFSLEARLHDALDLVLGGVLEPFPEEVVVPRQRQRP